MSPLAVRIKGGMQNDFKSLKGVLEHQKPSKLIVNFDNCKYIRDMCVEFHPSKSQMGVPQTSENIWGSKWKFFLGKPKPCAVIVVCTSYQDVCCCFLQIFHAQGDWVQFLLKFPCHQLFFLGIRYISQGKKSTSVPWFKLVSNFVEKFF